MRKHLRPERRTRPANRYNYPAKAVVRACLPQFFSAGLTRAEIGRVRAWFFPGPQATEYQGYRALGIPDTQLQGFEWAPAIAARIRAYAPTLSLHAGSLASFLSARRTAPVRCDWVNLDFDGIAASFAAEIEATIARLDAERAPRLAITSYASRDHTQLIASVIATAALEALIGRPRFLIGRDLRLVGDERAGLALDDRARRYAVARELGLCFLLLRAFGGRSYGPQDAATAAAFRRTFDRRYSVIRQKVEEAAIAHVRRGSAMPDIEDQQLRALVMNRHIPLWVDDGLRFVYRSPNERWMWTWAFRFTAVREPQSLDVWAEKLLCTVPPLHVIDVNGNEVQGRTPAAGAVRPTPEDGRRVQPAPIAAPIVPSTISALDEPVRPAKEKSGDGEYTFHGDEHIIPTIGDRIRADAARMSREQVYAKWMPRGYTKPQIAAAIAWARGALPNRRRPASR